MTAIADTATSRRRINLARKVVAATDALHAAAFRLGALPPARTAAERRALAGAQLAHREAERDLTRARRALREAAG